MQIIDISLPIKPGMITWPGENWVHAEAMTDFAVKGARVSRITLGSHTGTHVDAPRHFLKDGYGVDAISPEKLVGPCSVIMVEPKNGVGIEAEDLVGIALEKRVLFKTRNSSHLFDATFYDEYVFLTQSGAKYILEKGVELVGVDYLSVEKRGSPGHPVHTMLLKKEAVIVEGLNLAGVKAGAYSLMVAPLRFVGLDGAPARVFLAMPL